MTTWSGIRIFGHNTPEQVVNVMEFLCTKEHSVSDFNKVCRSFHKQNLSITIKRLYWECSPATNGNVALQQSDEYKVVMKNKKTLQPFVVMKGGTLVDLRSWIDETE